MQEIKIKFRGVRGSHPTPKHSHLKYGGNTSCVEVWAGNHLIILDAGTGIIDLGRDLQYSIRYRFVLKTSDKRHSCFKSYPPRPYSGASILFAIIYSNHNPRCLRAFTPV